MAINIPRSSLYVIESPHGHDSFLIEIQQLNTVCIQWLNQTLPYNNHNIKGLRSGDELRAKSIQPKL